MELFQAQDNFIILNGPDSLWCNRLDGRLQPRFGVDLGEAWSLKCRGIVYGVIGKIQFFPGADWRLIVISKQTRVGNLPGDHEVYRIDRIAVLTLSSSESPEFDLDPCEQHQNGGRARKIMGVGGGLAGTEKGLGQTWNKLKTAASTLKEKNIKDRDLKDKEKLERRFVEELQKMFNDSDSFYYSPTGDLTNTLQRQFSGKYSAADPVWKRCDKRFFWNHFMVKELLTSEDPLASKWATPIIQGYCKIEHCINTFQEEDADENAEKKVAPFPPEEFKLVLLSRRSIHRAGTRYRRRGVNDNGDVANFVETEQIICTSTHNVSFAQVRGSVPVYWSQPGYKYRPPPRLDRDEAETQFAFRKHFDHQLELYKTVAVINLVDQSGREKIISDVFMDNILAYNSPFLTYITFDFHEYCRGMRFENVSVLVESIPDVIKEVRYCWTDDKGIICDQRGVFRVNCMDCLDRTNVVQAALARYIMEQQLKKLGKQLPDQILPSSIRTAFQEMWASNGDAISRQYAGTAAMKGDFTRTGERRFTGVMKDGYNSANRYYLNRFKAAYRQTLIDVMLGNPVTEDIAALIAAMNKGPEEEQWTMEREECVAQLIQHCNQLLLADEEEYIGGWALVDPFYSTDGEVTQDQDVVLLLTYHAYYVASYDDEAERITQYERIALDDLEKIEIGFETTVKSKHLFIRIHRRYQGNSGYFHTLRTIQHRTAEDARSVLLSIADAFAAARASLDLGLKVTECRLDRKKTKIAPNVTQISSKSRLSTWSKPYMKVRSKSFVHDNKDDFSLASIRRTRLGSLPTSFSDSCLAKRGLNDEEVFDISCASAPQSCSSGSGSEDEDKVSGETDPMDYYDPEAAGSSQKEVAEDVEVSSKGKRSETEDLNDEEKSSSEATFVIGDDDTMNEEEAQNGVKPDSQREEGGGNSTESLSARFDVTVEEGAKSEGCHPVDVEGNDSIGFKREEMIGGNDQFDPIAKHEITNGHVSQAEDEENDDANASGMITGGSHYLQEKDQLILNEPSKPTKESGDKKEETVEHVNSSEKSVTGREDVSQLKQANGEVQAERCEASIEGLQVSYHGSGSPLKFGHSHSSVELGRMASTDGESNSEKSPERRRIGARFRNISVGNRVPKMNIFATAQARGRTLIPELRNKLSSFSQQVRSRSPRLNPRPRQSSENESNGHQKQTRKKCRTRIIEL